MNIDDFLRHDPIVLANENYLQASKLFIEKKYEEALSKNQFAINHAPEKYLPVYLEQRGHILMTMNRFDDGIDCFNRALKINPNLGMSYHYRGMSYFLSDRLELSLKDFKKSLELGIYPEARKVAEDTIKKIEFILKNNLKKKE